MNSYITRTNTSATDRSDEPRGYVTTGLAPATPTGYVSSDTRGGAGSYVSSEWVIAA